MKKVLMTYIESGMGHITSIASIQDNLKKYFDDEFEIESSYIMREDNDKVLINWEKFITRQTKNTNRLPGFGNFCFGLLTLLGGPKFLRFSHRTIFRRQTNHAIEAFKKRNPDVIVSTHYFMTFAALEYKRKVNPNCEVVTYNPDNNVHMWWDNRDHLFIVNNAVAYNEAINKKKFNPDFVNQVNYTARDSILNSNLTREEYREKLGIDKNQFCVIVADGVYACGKAKMVATQLLKSDKPMTLIFVAGKNQKLYNRFSKMKERGKVKKNIDLIVLPFTKEIQEYYKASDVFVTKAGPNAVLDSVFMGTPIIVDYYAHPIEKMTTKLFVEKLKVGKAIYKPSKIKKQIEAWIDDNSELKVYEKNTAAINKYSNGGKDAAILIHKYCQKESPAEAQTTQDTIDSKKEG